MEPISQNVHASGKCCFDFISFDKIVTCGVEGTIRLVGLNPLEDSGIEIYEDGGSEEKCQFVSISVNPSQMRMFAVAKENLGFDGKVELFEIRGENEDQAYLTSRVTGSNMGISDLSWTPNGEWLCVATDVDGIKVLKIEDPINSLVCLKEHSGGIKGIVCDPKGEYMASIGSDGSLKIWDINDGWTLKKNKFNFLERDSDNSYNCKPCWSLDGSKLACPGKRGISVIKRGDWDEEEEFEDGDFQFKTTHCTFSSTKLASCCGGNEPKLVVWDLKSKKILFSFLLANVFRSIAFSSDVSIGKEQLVGITNDGEVVQYEFEIQKKSKNEAREKKEEQPSTIDVVESTILLDEEAVEESEKKIEKEDELFGDEEDDVLPAATPVVTNDDDLTESLTQIKKAHGRNEDGERIPGFKDDGEEHIINDQEILALKSELNSLKEELEELRPVKCDFFQPSSTPFGQEDVLNEDPDHRFLVWNRIGTVVCRKDRQSDRIVQSIQIEFADPSFHRPLRFTDEDNFDKACLSESGAFFSSSSENVLEDEDSEEFQIKKSLLHFRAFNSPWASTSNWSFTLPKRESVTCIANGSDFCAAATSKGFLRIFRPSGLQEPVTVLPGPIYTMVGQGTFLLLLYYLGNPQHIAGKRRKERDVGYCLLDWGINGKAPKTTATGVFRSSEEIIWCGFSDESLGCIPLVYRRDGALLGLSIHWNWTWVVLADGSGLEKGLKLWPISASRAGGLLAVALRSGRKQPSVVPRSSPALFQIRIPILGLSKELDQKKMNRYDHEEESLLEIISVDQRKWLNAEDDEEINKAVALADVALLRGMIVSVKTKNYSRALGLTSKLRLKRSYELALKQAQQVDADSEFLEKLVTLVDARLQEEDEDEEIEMIENSQHTRKRLKQANVEEEEEEVYENAESEEEQVLNKKKRLIDES